MKDASAGEVESIVRLKFAVVTAPVVAEAMTVKVPSLLLAADTATLACPEALMDKPLSEKSFATKLVDVIIRRAGWMLALAVVLACTIMTVRMAILVAATNPSLLRKSAPMFGAMALAGALAAGVLYLVDDVLCELIHVGHSWPLLANDHESVGGDGL